MFRHDVARGPVPRWRIIFGIRRRGGQSLDGLVGAWASQAVAGEIDPVGVVDEAIEDGVGVGGIADHLVPFVDRDLAGDDGRAAAVAFFEDFEQVVAGGGIERFEAPIVEDEQLDAAERPHEAGIAAVAAGEREIGEQLGNALVEDGAVVAAGLVAERAGKPTFADAGRAAQDQILVGVDPVAVGELLEQRAIEAARGAVIDILDDGLMAQPGIAQPGEQALVAAIADLAIEQQAEPFGMGERRGFAGCFELGEGLGHAGKPELVQLIEGGMGEQGVGLLIGSSAGRGCWGGGSARRPRRAGARRGDRACCRGWSGPSRR